MFRHLVWLLALGAVALWQLPQIPNWPLGWQALLAYAPYAVAATGIFVSLLLNRLRPVLLLLTLILAVFLNSDVYLFTDWLPYRAAGSFSLLYALLAFLLPLNVLLWMFLPERGARHKLYTAVLLALFALQGYGLYWALNQLPEVWMTWFTRPVTLATDSAWHLPMVATVAWILAVSGLIARLAMLHKPRVLDLVALFVVVLSAIGLNSVTQFGGLNWLVSVAALMVLLSLVFDAHHIAYTDELTGMAGRRALFESFMGLGRRYTIAMLDIDHFKKFNDTYGHDVGDLVLRTVSKVLAQVGGAGKAYRFGGEEFSIVFAGKSPEQVRAVLDALRNQVEATPLQFEHQGKPTTTKVTVSIGVAEKNREFKTPDEVMKAADQALYQAKEMGRNRVVVYGDPQTQSISKGPKSARIRKRTPAKTTRTAKRA